MFFTYFIGCMVLPLRSDTDVARLQSSLYRVLLGIQSRIKGQLLD